LKTLHVLEAVEVPVERSDCDTLVGRDRRHPGVGKVDRVGLEPLQRVQHDRFRRHLETTTSDEVTKGVRHLGPVLLVEAGEDERGLGDDCGVEVQLDLSRGALQKQVGRRRTHLRMVVLEKPDQQVRIEDVAFHPRRCLAA